MNIAHFKRKILSLLHILQNYEPYSQPRLTPSIAILAEKRISAAFVQPQSFNHYISGFFDVVISPHKAQIGTFHDLIARASRNSTRFIQIIESNISSPTRNESLDATKFIWFLHRIAPNYMRGRFSVNHPYYAIRSRHTFTMN